MLLRWLTPCFWTQILQGMIGMKEISKSALRSDRQWKLRQFNRKRLKGRSGEEDGRIAPSTLYNVLLLSCKVMAPFTPFLTEELYQNMRKLLLVQDGKLYGRYPMFSMITRVVGLPEVTENHDIQKNKFMVQLGQVDMRFNVKNAYWLNDRIRDKILQTEKNRINKDRELVISSTKTRTQKFVSPLLYYLFSLPFGLMQSYPPRALDRRLQEDWAKDAREGPRVLMSIRVDFRPKG
ncbi:Isoleucine--tRNA ligase, cytoplasmic [Glycine soja]|uniref:Isoleucine--tRNA ligase, cytoplasmic n=1 Tax=Glycine soja TaxID=3848 RepID=A0A445H6W7_GLYSO|nr:Isoleucine--tRNA ligase, cytoplasmic [Glycine soja]